MISKIELVDKSMRMWGIIALCTPHHRVMVLAVAMCAICLCINCVLYYHQLMGQAEDRDNER